MSTKSAFDVLMSNRSNKKRKIIVVSSNLETSLLLNEKCSKKNVDLSGNSKKKKQQTIDSSVSELKKAASSFDPNKAAYWGKDERVPFMFFVKGLDAISQFTGRIVVTDILCNMLRTVIETTPQDLLAFVYLLVKRIGPAYHEGMDLGLGDTAIIKAVAEACGAKESHIQKQYDELGDLGLSAKAVRSSQSLIRIPEPLTVSKVFDKFHMMAKESGKDSQKKKTNHIKSLLVAATDGEPIYLVRLLKKGLRIGVAEQTLLIALGHAAVYSGKHLSSPKHVESPLEEAAEIVKQVYSVCPVYDKIIPALLAGSIWDLPKTCSFTLGIPIGPMLAKSTTSLSEIFDKFQGTEFTCEYKYDGERGQIHYLANGSVEIYSRNAQRNTEKFPDVVAAVARLKNPSVTSFVLDCELVALDREKQRFLPFQVLRTRARKNVIMSEIGVQVCIYAFDLLYLNGQSLLQDQLNIRREKLYKSFEEEPGFFQFATAISSNDPEEIQGFLQASVNSGSEGLIIKTLNSIGDSFDLVPIGAFHGRGKRIVKLPGLWWESYGEECKELQELAIKRKRGPRNLNADKKGVYGAFLLACYDNSKDEFQSICKIGTGFSDAKLKECSVNLRSKVIPKPKSYFRYKDSMIPDVWFEPTEVWEVKAAGLTASSVYCAAIGVVDPDKGISLQFPRLLKTREDKGPEQATSSDMVAEMYIAQNERYG
ncbi:tRNA ligase [Orobanche hederae]